MLRSMLMVVVVGDFFPDCNNMEAFVAPKLRCANARSVGSEWQPCADQ